MKNIVRSIVIFAAVAALTACSGNKPVQQPQPQQESPAPTDVAPQQRLAAPNAKLHTVRLHCVSTKEAAKQDRAWVEKNHRAGKWCDAANVTVRIADEFGTHNEQKGAVIGGSLSIPVPLDKLHGDVAIIVQPEKGKAVHVHVARTVEVQNIAFSSL